jgi:hypothetical protein
VATKKCEIKYEKNIIPCGMSTAVNPAKRDVKRTMIELTMLDSRLGEKPAHGARPIAISFLGTRGSLVHLLPSSPLLLTIGGLALARGLSPPR